jgi:hypothetical protein
MLSPAPLVWLLRFIIPLSVFFTAYLYSYPAVHRCQFPSTSNGQVAPFRLLTFGDPQLEGDTSLPRWPLLYLPNVTILQEQFHDGNYTEIAVDVKDVLRGGLTLPIRRVWYFLKYARKRVDLLGNDFYLAHVYRALHWWMEPTHVTVVGDLLGSQWIRDEEFERRSWRFWKRVFKGSEKISDEIIDPYYSGTYTPHREMLGEEPAWSRRIINVAGNHDIGYAGDVTEERIERFEREFGPVNGEVSFFLPPGSFNATANSHPPTIRLVAFNTMTLDSPARSFDIQVETIDFINAAIGASAPVEDHHTAVILLTHIPLYKEAGICVDSPLFSYHADESIKEQNFLSPGSSKDAILHGLYGFHPDPNMAARGMGRDGIILTGHDHEGCDVYHYADRATGEWRAQKWVNATTPNLVEGDFPGIREVTVRSMMGAYSGNAALLSAWWDEDRSRWSIEVSNCRLGVQHVWWFVHSLNFSVVFFSVLTLIAYTWPKETPSITTKSKSKSKESTGRSPVNQKKGKGKSKTPLKKIAK